MNRRQTIPKELRFTIQQFQERFPDDNACLEYLKEQRYPGGLAHCEKCGVERKHHRVTGRPAYACDYCGSMISPMAGTIFEKSSTSLKTWFYAMYLMGSTRCGISAKQIQRETGVTYKTAWRIFRQIRTLMSEDIRLEGSTVEVDEMYVGGKSVRLGATAKPKTPVVGVVHRKSGRVIARVKADTTKPTLHGFIKEFVLPGSTVFTDDYPSYKGINVRGYQHFRVKHTAKVYVAGSRGQIHTQTIDGFWSLVKNGLRGVYHSVGKNYLQSYLNEYSFRYNRRESGNLIFGAILGRVCELAGEQHAAQAPQIQTT
ncbi:MAG: IS1595 family transposase [Acidobacteriia bacterium]|nr:IS1595 family transposase [Terriglobia bacterium]